MRMLRTALVLCAGMAPAAAAETWPSRPVKLVVPFSAAGTADLLARLVADRLGPVLGQPVVVEHRPGAGGIVGQEQVARASPDGYTLVVSSLGSFIISPVFTPVPFDPFRDFTHMAYLGGQPVALFANKDLPFRTLPDLVAYAKSRPGAVTYATISIGSQTQLLNEQFQTQAGIKMTHVPYRAALRYVQFHFAFEPHALLASADHAAKNPSVLIEYTMPGERHDLAAGKVRAQGPARARACRDLRHDRRYREAAPHSAQVPGTDPPRPQA